MLIWICESCTHRPQDYIATQLSESRAIDLKGCVWSHDIPQLIMVSRVTASIDDLEHLVIHNVNQTGKQIGCSVYGVVFEVEYYSYGVVYRIA